MVREDAGDGRVEFGEPHGRGVEDVLDGEVEAAVAAEQRPDPESWFAADVEVVHEVCSGDGRPGIRASLSTDAELVTCQVHELRHARSSSSPACARPTPHLRPSL